MTTSQSTLPLDDGMPENLWCTDIHFTKAEAANRVHKGELPQSAVWEIVEIVVRRLVRISAQVLASRPVDNANVHSAHWSLYVVAVQARLDV